MKINQYIKIIILSIVMCSKIMLELVSQPKFSKLANTCFFVLPVFQPWFHSDTFWPFWFFCFEQNYLSKLMLLDFCCQKISFLCKDNFCIDEKHTQWHWDTDVKEFHESISWFIKCPWNCTHEMLWKKNFTVYPSL